VKNILKVMEEDWDLRAETNALVYANSSRKHWELNEFFAQGEKEVNLFIKDVVKVWGSVPKDKRMLEIGSGIGRQTRAFSKMFAEVYALDVSNVMITKAKQLNSDLKNVKFIKTNGQDLRNFPDNYFDFVYSYGTFQHISDKRVISNYFREIHRVLKIGGLFKIHLAVHSKGWYFASGFIPIPGFIMDYLPFWLAKTPIKLVKILEFLYTKVSHILSKVSGVPPFVGSVVTAVAVPPTNAQITQMIQNSDLSILELFQEELPEEGQGRKYVITWCLGQKK